MPIDSGKFADLRSRREKAEGAFRAAAALVDALAAELSARTRILGDQRRTRKDPALKRRIAARRRALSESAVYWPMSPGSLIASCGPSPTKPRRS